MIEPADLLRLLRDQRSDGEIQNVGRGVTGAVAVAVPVAIGCGGRAAGGWSTNL